MSLEQEIDALLPQTQCTKCGYAGCRPYAEAIAAGRADIDQCPPGGAAGIARLARLLERAPKPLNRAYGVESPRTAASIDEARCIGCTLCIRACPVDAIVGAPKQMHTVLIAQCTGCELCIPPCPVDCIELLSLRELAARGASSAAEQADTPVATHASRWRRRFEQHQQRLARERREREARLAAKAEEQRCTLPAPQPGAATARKRAAVRAALERARARRVSIG